MKLAVMVDSLGPGHLAHALIARANELVTARPDVDVVVLYETLVRPCLTPMFATVQCAEGWSFDGPVVATTLSTARKLLRYPAAVKKLFLVWDLEWVGGGPRAYRDLRAVYGHPDLTLLARSRSHARAVRDCWNREPVLVTDFDLERILEVAHG